MSPIGLLFIPEGFNRSEKGFAVGSVQSAMRASEKKTSMQPPGRGIDRQFLEVSVAAPNVVEQRRRQLDLAHRMQDVRLRPVEPERSLQRCRAVRVELGPRSFQ